MRRAAWILLALALVVAGCGDGRSTTVPKDEAATTGTTLPPPVNGGCDDPKAAVIVFDADGARRWAVGLPHEGNPQASGPVAHGDVVLTNHGGELRAFDARTGAERWRRRVGQIVYGEWVIAGVVVAVVDQVGADALVLGIDPAGGKELWRYEVPGRGLLGEQVPTDDGGLAVIEAAGGALSVIDAKTGKPRWSAPGREESAAFTASGTTVIRSVAPRLVAYDTATGQQRWSVDAGGEIMPEVVDGLVLSVSGVYPNPAPMAAYRLSDGSRAWTATLAYDVGTAYVTPSGLLIDGGPIQAEQRLMLLDPATGKPRWDIPADVYVNGPVVAGDFLVASEGVPGVSAPSKVVVRRLSDGTVVSTVDTAYYSDAAVAGERVYLAGLGGDVPGEMVAVEGGAVVWRKPLDRMAHNRPAVLSDGGVAVQVADAMCGMTLDAKPATG